MAAEQDIGDGSRPRRSHSLNVKDMAREQRLLADRVARGELSEAERAELAEESEAWEEGQRDRPKTWAACRETTGPCPYVSCRHHLFLDINPKSGSVKFNFPGKELWELEETCSLRAADSAHTLDGVADLMNMTRERVRQVEDESVERIKSSISVEAFEPGAARQVQSSAKKTRDWMLRQTDLWTDEEAVASLQTSGSHIGKVRNELLAEGLLVIAPLGQAHNFHLGKLYGTPAALAPPVVIKRCHRAACRRPPGPSGWCETRKCNAVRAELARRARRTTRGSGPVPREPALPEAQPQKENP